MGLAPAGPIGFLLQRTKAGSEHPEFAKRPGGVRQTTIGRHDRDTQTFSNCDIPSVVSRDVVAKFPDPIGERFKRKPVDVESVHIPDRPLSDGFGTFS